MDGVHFSKIYKKYGVFSTSMEQYGVVWSSMEYLVAANVKRNQTMSKSSQKDFKIAPDCQSGSNNQDMFFLSYQIFLPEKNQ